MELVKKQVIVNKGAVELLESLLEQVKKGSIISLGVSYVTADGDIGTGISDGSETLLLWSSMVHGERSFYDEFIRG